MRDRGTILWVDDEPFVLEIAAKVIGAKTKFDLVAAADGDEAMRIFRRRRRSIVIVVSNFMMPGMNRVQMGRAMRKIEPDIPLLFVTGVTFRALREGAMELGGVIRVTHKPFQIDPLLGWIREMARPPHPQCHAKAGSRRAAPG